MKSTGHRHSKMMQVLSFLGQKHAEDWLAQIALIPYIIGGFENRFYCSKQSRSKFAQQKDRLVSLVLMVSMLQSCTNFYR